MPLARWYVSSWMPPPEPARRSAASRADSSGEERSRVDPGGRVRGDQLVEDREQRVQGGGTLPRIRAGGRDALLVPKVARPERHDRLAELRATRLDLRRPDHANSVPDVAPLMEALPAHLVRKSGDGQCVLDGHELRVHPDEHGNLRGRDALRQQPLRLGRDRKQLRIRHRGSGECWVPARPGASRSAPSIGRSPTIRRLASSRICGLDR